MSKWRKRPIVIEAVQITDSTFDAPHPNPEHVRGVIYNPHWRYAEVRALEGVMTGHIGDWIITDADGVVSLCKGSIFIRTYEPLTETRDGYRWRCTDPFCMTVEDEPGECNQCGRVGSKTPT